MAEKMSSRAQHASAFYGPRAGQYLFLRQGGKVVFFGRFVALWRMLAAFLAGVNRMEWSKVGECAGRSPDVGGRICVRRIYARARSHLPLQGVLGPILLAIAAVAFFGCGLLI